MAIVWGLNGYFQSFGALSIVKVNAQWFHVRERGTFAGVFGVLIRLGLLLAFQGVPLIFLFFPWQYAFWIPAFCVAVFFLVNLKWMQNSPEGRRPRGVRHRRRRGSDRRGADHPRRSCGRCSPRGRCGSSPPAR